MKNIGIWLDKEKAYIIRLENGKEHIDMVISQVENYHIGGGSGTRFKGGPQDVVQDSRYLEREKHQLRTYFSDIAAQLKDADAIVIFGPAETKDKLAKELQNNFKVLSAKVKNIKTSDSMTENQLKALVRDSFN
jgi:stalled ribosome rescue protein Dom34